MSDADFLISSSIRLLDREFINKAFATDDMHWAKPIPTDQLELLLSRSLTLGLYKVLPAGSGSRSADSPSSPRTPSPTMEDSPGEELEQIGMARFITDFVTFSYLTDVYVSPEYRKYGLGKWIVACCKEVMDAVPQKRRSLLLTSPKVGLKFYERELGFRNVVEDRDHMICMASRGSGFGNTTTTEDRASGSS